MPTPKKLIGTIVAVAIVVPLTTTIAQDPVGDISDDSWVGVVTTGPAVVRCGAMKVITPLQLHGMVILCGSLEKGRTGFRLNLLEVYLRTLLDI